MKRIALTQGKFALVDDEDFERLSAFKWSAFRNKNKFYAVRHLSKTISRKRNLIQMHREILPATVGVEIDHKNGNGLDNRKDNLRFASSQQNKQSARKRINTSSRFKGVSLYKPTGAWRARINIQGKEKSLGYSYDEIEAARKYDRAALQHFGEFARLNFPNLPHKP